MKANPTHRMCGVEFGPAPPGQPGSIYRMERGSTAAQHSLYCLQYAFSDLAMGDSSSSGLASARAHGPSAIAGLGARLRAPHLFPGDLRGPGTVSGNLLRAANWVLLGHTTGRGKDDHTNRRTAPLKRYSGFRCTGGSGSY